MKSLAPIALFVYNRLDHLRLTIDSLTKNNLASESDLIIFSDAAKNENVQLEVERVRAYIKKFDGFKSVSIIEREKNLGLANSIISGVSDIVERYGKIIVVEDDLVTSKYFLQYMNDALELYEHEEQVISIHGYVYPMKEQLPETFFLRGTDCWGWATWRRGWKYFNPDGEMLLRQLKKKNLLSEFDFDDSYGYTKMLERQIAGKVNSWAVRWNACAFIENKLTLYSGRSLVNNIGESDSATHTKSLQEFQTTVAQEPIDVGGIAIEENNDARLAFIRFFNSIQQSLWKKIFKKIKSLF